MLCFDKIYIDCASIFLSQHLVTGLAAPSQLFAIATCSSSTLHMVLWESNISLQMIQLHQCSLSCIHSSRTPQHVVFNLYLIQNHSILLQSRRVLFHFYLKRVLTLKWLSHFVLSFEPCCECFLTIIYLMSIAVDHWLLNRLFLRVIHNYQYRTHYNSWP